jgi:hypothetical protein
MMFVLIYFLEIADGTGARLRAQGARKFII